MPFLTPDGHIAFGSKSDCTLDICDAEYSIFSYRPSLPANVALAGIFLAIMAVHTYLGIRWKTWGYMAGMQIGCICEIVGYAGRILLYRNPFKYLPFVLQTILLTIAPVFFTGSIYVTLSKSITFYAPDMTRVKPAIFVWVFLPADIICLVLQSVGGALSAKGDTPEDSENGNRVSQAGLSFQLVVLVGFLVAFSDFFIRFLRSGRVEKVTWRMIAFLVGVYASVLLILGRCAFRVVELKDGYKGEMMKHEIPFVVFEGVFMVLAIIALFWGHPGLALKDEEIYRPEKNSGSETDLYDMPANNKPQML